MEYLPYVLLPLFIAMTAAPLLLRRAGRRREGQLAPAAARGEGRRVYYFFSEQCGPCRALAPLVDRLADEFPGGLVKVDVTREPGLAQGFGILGTPSFAAVDGERILRIVVGGVSEKRLREMLDGSTG